MTTSCNKLLPIFAKPRKDKGKVQAKTKRREYYRVNKIIGNLRVETPEDREKYAPIRLNTTANWFKKLHATAKEDMTKYQRKLKKRLSLLAQTSRYIKQGRTKVCGDCKEEKALCLFNKRTVKRKKSNMIQYRSYCKKCQSKRNKEYYDNRRIHSIQEV